MEGRIPLPTLEFAVATWPDRPSALPARALVMDGLDMDAHNSVTTWIGLLEQGNAAAAQRLWERYFQGLVQYARKRLHGLARQVADEEDVALSAFHAFCQAAAQQRLPRLGNRDELWRTLLLITAGKAVTQRCRQQSVKRGGPTDPHERPVSLAELENVIGPDPDPAFAALVADEFRYLMDRLRDPDLKAIALLKLEGYSNEEIAERLPCSLRTVTRRLTVIRRLWESADEPAGAGP